MHKAFVTIFPSALGPGSWTLSLGPEARALNFYVTSSVCVHSFVFPLIHSCYSLHSIKLNFTNYKSIFLFIHLSIHGIIHQFIHQMIQSLMYQFMELLIYQLMKIFVCSFMGVFIYSWNKDIHIQFKYQYKQYHYQ